ncbi:MAG: MBOAT family protein [Candidatus Omnitrophica bacterium]|nr:MBOAT family protein [Candidatus Omnitrophota bacterium]
MIFNSIQFAVFFLIVYVLYLLLDHKGQNRMLLLASYIFYGAWDYRFLSLIFISTIIDYHCGIRIHESNNAGTRKKFLFLSVFANLGILGFFKYFNFFAGSLSSFLYVFGFSADFRFLFIVLPVGISFYTFQTMSYTIDIYRRQLKPTHDFPDFALFVAFFPQLVAGPIERAKRLLPQLLKPRKVTLDSFYKGSYLIAWGLFQKVFVADNLAKIVDSVFTGVAPYEGALVLMSLYAFAFQIFCDFAGYSNIARGLGKCMGIELMVNFKLPYFATNPREFWQRWHISLSTWLRDYLYISLGGNRRGELTTCRNLAITMFLGGLWHGASWTFVLWGVFHGLLLIIHRFIDKRKHIFPQLRIKFIERLWFYLRVIFFFHLVCLGWLIFRAESFNQIGQMLSAIIFNFNLSFTPEIFLIADKIIFYISVLFFVQIFQYRKNDLMYMFKTPLAVRVIFYFICVLLFLIFGAYGGREFIYFQF